MSALFRSRALAEMGFGPVWRLRECDPDDAGQVAEASDGNAVLEQPRNFLRLERSSIEALGLEGLGRAIEACRGCDRSEQRHRAIAGAGPASPMLMVIDQVPSLDASRLGEYLAAEPARMLDQIFFALGLRRHQIYLSYAVRCDGVPVTSAHRDACSAYLARELALLQPRAVLALGSGARSALQQVGSWSESDCFEIEHPMRMLGDAAAKRNAWAVVREIKRHLTGPGISAIR